MAAQAFFSRASALISGNCRVVLSNRPTQLMQMCVSWKSSDKFKDLPVIPKRPLTPYFRFVRDHRQSVVNQHPDWKTTQVAIQCSADWRASDSSVKDKYRQEFQEEMERYTVEATKFRASLTDEQKEAFELQKKDAKKTKERRVRRRNERDAEKPKKPAGAYGMFVVEQAKIQNKLYKDLLKELKETWAAMNDLEKAKYLDAVTIAHKRYEVDLKNWEEEMLKQGRLELVRQKTKDEYYSVPSHKNTSKVLDTRTKQNDESPKKRASSRRVIKYRTGELEE